MSKRAAFVVAISVALGLCAYAAGPTFRPDFIFKASTLAGWSPLGAGDWKAVNGEIVGTPKTPAGGWLVLNKSFEDVGVFSNITCDAGCKAGILLRAEKTSDGGMKGILLQIENGELKSFAVKIDAQGTETQRDALPPGGRGGRGAGPGGARAGGAGAGAPGPGAPGAAATGGGGGRRAASQAGATTGGGGGQTFPLPPGVSLPGLARRSGAYVPGQSNAVDINLTYDGYTVKLNGAAAAGAAGQITDQMGKFGPIALYAGGTAPAHFKDIAYEDFIVRPFEPEKTSPNFTVQRLSEFYYSYSASVADINHDGIPDIVAGPFYYLGPDYSAGHQIYVPESFNPTSQYALPAMVQLAYDFTGDGWPDVLSMSGNAGNGVGTLYVNPRGESRRWDSFVVMQPPEHVVGGEETLLKDIDGDGRPEIIHSGNGALQYSKPDPANPTGPWVTTTISELGPWGGGGGFPNLVHGIGVGDINGDGRMDFVTTYGWWEQPPKGSGQKLWTYHPAELGRNATGGAEMGVYDVNGDGLNDVVTALEAHGFGAAWYEQKRDAAGKISFVQHMIFDSALDKNAGDVWFTQPHGTAFADINGDGIPDFIVGKRHHSHFEYGDPDNFSMPVLYVYKTVRNKNAPGGAEFVPELVSNRSGVGSHIGLGDLNKDGTTDIVVSGASGTFIFFNKYKKGAR
jgi:hypothetical protein